MRVPPHFAVLLAPLALVAAVAAAPAGASPRPAAPPAYAVVGLLDDGINPYHKAFRDPSPRAYQHPSTYLPGYPKNAKPLRITLDGTSSLADALRRDCDRIWSDVEPGTLYWFPGTRIVGAISVLPGTAGDCAGDVPIVGSGGHGTMTASRAAGAGYGACPECLVVMVQGISTTYVTDGVSWLGDNSGWIDVQSHSWGPIAPAWTPTETGRPFTGNAALSRAAETGARKHLAFWASGNGAGFRFGVLGHPTQLASHLTPSTLIVGGHDSGFVATWPGFTAHLVSDACHSWAAEHDNNNSSNNEEGGGTSAATPYAAGHAARVLLEARRIVGERRTGVRGGVAAAGAAARVKNGPLLDGRLTLAEWRDVVLKTASDRPRAHEHDGPPCGALEAPYLPTPVRWSDVPAGVPAYAVIGYGATDPAARATAFAVLRGTRNVPDRADADRFFANDRALREALYPVWTAA